MIIAKATKKKKKKKKTARKAVDVTCPQNSVQ